MKLVYLANLRLPTEKAYGIQIAKMCEAFANNGHDVLLLYPYRKNLIEKDLFNYYSVKNNFKLKQVPAPDFYFPGVLDRLSFLIKNYLSAKRLVLEALKENADVYYTRDEQIAYILNKQNKNIVFECHRFSSKRKQFYLHFKRIVAISKGLKDDLLKFGVKENNIFVVHDGVDLEAFNINISKENARNNLKLPLDKKIVVYTGHLYEWKGAHVLLEATRKFQFKGVVFVFVGGTDKDVKEFKKKAEGSDNVFILGHKPYQEIPVYLKAADVLVLPNSAKETISQKYTSPLKLFEYMASGRPIVASNLPSISEILNNSNAVLVNSDNANDLADGINKLINNTILSGDIAKKALEDVKEYTWQKRAERIIKFISE